MKFTVCVCVCVCVETRGGVVKCGLKHGVHGVFLDMESSFSFFHCLLCFLLISNG